MRSITKGTCPPPLTAWLGTYSHTSVSWGEFGRNHLSIKQDVKRGLVADQGAVCCYCEREIGCAGTRPDAHIEHLLPKSAHPHLTYAWGNLLASCEDEKHRGQAPESCGHQKGVATIAVTPLQAGCTAKFLFDGAGHVAPAPGLSAAEQDDVRDTIDTLGLDTARPCSLRKAAIDTIVGVVLNEADVSAAAQAELLRLSRPDANGKWTPFVTAITQALQQLL